jgi:hypothetical protein
MTGLFGRGGLVPHTPGGFSDAAKRRTAERRLEDEWNKRGGAPGAQKVPGDGGLIDSQGRYYREYANGSLYYDANVPVFVYGAIGDRYRQLGGPASWLGWPLSDEMDFDEGGRFSRFEHGSIYFWGDTGAIELASVAVRFRGYLCWSESDDGPFSSHDEPYVWFTVVPPPPGQPSNPRTVIRTKVDAGHGYPENMELYRGLPFGLALGAVLMEHDSSGQDPYREEIEGIVAAASTAVVGAVSVIPGIGPVLGAGAAVGLKAANEDIVNALNDLVGAAPDHIGTVGVNVTPKQMVTMTRAPRHNHWGVDYHLVTPLISGDGADYKLCFDIEAV